MSAIGTQPAHSLAEIFDVEAHPHASTHVAQELLARLGKDVAAYAEDYSGKRTPQLLSLQPEARAAGVQAAEVRRVCDALGTCE